MAAARWFAQATKARRSWKSEIVILSSKTIDSISIKTDSEEMTRARPRSMGNNLLGLLTLDKVC